MDSTCAPRHLTSVGSTRSTIQVEPDTDALFALPGKLQLAEDGVMRYFGATSNLHWLHNGPFSSFRPDIHELRVHGHAALEKAQLLWDPDQTYIDSLFELYFTWDNALTNTVDLAVFHRENARYDQGLQSNYYSTTLENAM